MSRRMIPGLITLAVVLSCYDLRSPTEPAGSLGLPVFAVRNVGCDVEGLRAAITAANRDAEADIINLQAGCTYTVTGFDNSSETIENAPVELGANAFPIIISPITINGNGATIERPPGGGDFRFFYVLNGPQYVLDECPPDSSEGDPPCSSDYALTKVGGAKGSLTLNQVTLSGGNYADRGAALYVFGGATVIIKNSRLVGNEAGDHGGALFTHGATVTIRNSAIEGNLTSDQGGAFYNESGTLEIYHSTISNNSSGDNAGAVQNVGGTVAIHHSTIANNYSGDNGAGLSNTAGGVLILYGSTVSDHQIIGDHGAVFNDGSTLEITNSTIRRNSGSDGGAGVHTAGATAKATITGSLITENESADSGGGIINIGGTLTLLLTTISNNVAGDDGGGLANEGGTLQIDQSTITNNTAADNGAGLSNTKNGVLVVRNSFFSQNAATEAGGGLYNYDGFATVTGSTIAGNSALYGGGVADEGAELEAAEFEACEVGQPCDPIEPGEPVGGVLTLVNSTISGNHADERGGGVFNDAGGRLSIIASTITGNTATVKTGGGVMSYNDIDASAEIRASIVVGNTPNDVAAAERKTSFTSHGHNLIGTAGPYVDFNVDFNAAGDRTNVSLSDVALGELADNGGGTKTHALLPGSIALDVIPTGACPATKDQRGISRPQPAAGPCDVGALEANSAKLSQVITFAPPASPRQYGDRFTVNPTSSSGLPVALRATGGCSKAIAAGGGYVVTMTSGITACTLKASQAGDAAFAAASSVTHVVNTGKKELTVTARTEQIFVGTSPSLVIYYAGFAGLDNERDLGGSIVHTFTGTDLTTYGPSTTVPSAAGTYSVMPSGLTSDNYSFTYVAGVLTIAKIELIVTARSERVPLTTPPSLVVDYAGFVGTDNESDLGGSLVHTFTGRDFTTYGPSTVVPTAAGRYSVMPAGLTSDKYFFTYVAGALTITAGIHFESYAYASNDGGTALTIDIPAGTKRGDFLLAQITFEKGSVAGTNDEIRSLGWRTARRTDNGTDLGQAIFYRIATGSVNDAFTATFAQRVAAAGAILRYTGVNPTDPIIATSGRVGTSDPLTPITAPTVAAEANSMAVAFFALKRKQTSLSTPEGMTQRYYFESPLNLALLGADRIKASTGPHWSKTSTASVMDKWVAQQVSIRED